MGGETAHQASERFARTVAEVTSGSMEQNVVVVTHGTVLALFVAQATGLEPFALWNRLGLPSFVVLRFPPIELISVVEQIAAEW